MTDNILIDFGQQCKNCCKSLGDYTKISITDLADNYIKATENNDQVNRDIYISALILRFWRAIKQLYQKTKSTQQQLGVEDFITIIYNRIEYACKYHAWQDPEKHTTAEACINKAISTEALNMFYFSNMHKYKANANTLSIEANYNDDPDNDTISDILEEEDSSDEYEHSNVAARSYIQSFINKNKLIEAIILDTIAFSNYNSIKLEVSKKTAINSDGEKYKYTDTTSSFNPSKTVSYLNDLPSSYDKYFKKVYNVKDEVADVALSTIRKASKAKLTKYLNNTLSTARAIGF